MSFIVDVDTAEGVTRFHDRLRAFFDNIREDFGGVADTGA